MSELMEKTCEICKGELWVCENHMDVAWKGGNQSCCGGAGMPCECNPQAKSAPGTTIIWDIERGYLQ